MKLHSPELCMAQVISHHPLTAQTWLWFQSSICEIFSTKKDRRTGFPLITSVFPCQYNSTKALYLYSAIYHQLHIILAIDSALLSTILVLDGYKNSERSSNLYIKNSGSLSL
jgi:hypothetical protein